MLDLETRNLSESDLSLIASGHCVRFGTVKHVKIMMPAPHRDYALAAVEMSNAEEAERVRVAIGDSKIGPIVIIRLLPPTAPELGNLDPAAADVVASADRDSIEILLVEDDPADVRMTREALNAVGVPHNLHVVTNGLEAISFLYRTRQFGDAPEPHVVLVDLNLPKVNGHEVLLEIKSNDRLKHIPVVVLTSSKAERDIRLSYQADADWFVTKPTGFDAYVDAMKRVETLVNH